MQTRPERISSLNVEPGLYVLRYLPAGGDDHPIVFVRPSPGDESGLSVVPFPGEPADRLREPGSLAVLVVPHPAVVQITARASFPNGSLQAELRLEPLNPKQPAVADRPAAEPAPAASRPAPVIAPADSVRLRAHVARRGDVAVPEAAWVGGPDAPAPVEGLAVDCAPALGEVQIQVMAAGDARWSDWLGHGAFGGSRGRSQPLTGLRLRFVPASGVEASLEAEALFLGSAVQRAQGRDIEFRSAAGVDPLLGLRVALRRQAPAPAPQNSAAQVPPGAPGSRVRVFRASARPSFDRS